SVAYGAGSYQPTRDGKALVWNDLPKRGEEVTWSGRRDKNGFAAGSGTLTWYQVEPTIVTGSNIPNARRYAVVISRRSGKMVEGKFEGAVTYVDANGKRLQASLVNGGKRPVKRNFSPAAQETPTAVQQTASVAPEQTATQTSEQQARQPDAQSTIAPMPTPLALPTPPLTVDAQMVGALDTVYRAALKANDIAIMDQILADDFVLVNDQGASLTKADLINEAREKRTIYDEEGVEEGTQNVRVWRDTAVVTELLKIKGTEDQPPSKSGSVRRTFGPPLVGVAYLGKLRFRFRNRTRNSFSTTSLVFRHNYHAYAPNPLGDYVCGGAMSLMTLSN